MGSKELGGGIRWGVEGATCSAVLVIGVGSFWIDGPPARVILGRGFVIVKAVFASSLSIVNSGNGRKLGFIPGRRRWSLLLLGGWFGLFPDNSQTLCLKSRSNFSC